MRPSTSLPAPQPSPPSIEVLRAVDLGDGRHVATVRVGAIRLGSIFAIDDDELRGRVEAAILSRVAGGGA